MGQLVAQPPADDLLTRVRRRLADASDPTAATAEAIAEAVRQEAGGVIGDAELLRMVRTMRDELTGAGVLDPLLRLPGVTDILVTSPDEVWIDRGAGMERVEVCFPGPAEVRRLAVRLAGACGRRLDDAQPYVDAHLPGGIGGVGGAGVRVHAVLSPPAKDHTLISLRVLHPARRGLVDLAESGFAPPEAIAMLRAVIAHRCSFLVSGGTGTGKTTLLSALLAEVAATERIVCIEDTPELQPAHPHVVSLVTRPPNIEGAGEITRAELLRQALRMRPDRVVVGEVRGGEIVDLLGALNTGHQGGGGTVHANTIGDVPARVEALGALGGVSAQAIAAQFIAAVHVVIGVRRSAQGRRLAAIGVVEPDQPMRVSQVWPGDRDAFQRRVGELS
ncbi:TadA family conjugal transfer-associated ATPase [Corynebacterium sp. TAE3-ERU12]|uniref:TadA family conjugal transfer-associated ATPase n=1 Tax=Corynebacterium sp. TAE3-ERU12 TaxID=2849491 RepID=UPI001C44030E|nr:TadA family conjugal transfer-associated ATPase [Corynebacterium sp. TAE3-ERU12]MBV7294488.1 TadA family conjugal transfer-associated ATPase [Corynebacterium sp. TAE3-ERU12]